MTFDHIGGTCVRWFTPNRLNRLQKSSPCTWCAHAAAAHEPRTTLVASPHTLQQGLCTLLIAMHLLQHARLQSGRWYAESALRSQVHWCPSKICQASALCASTLHFGSPVQTLQALTAPKCRAEQQECAPAVSKSSVARDSYCRCGLGTLRALCRSSM